jgi:ribosome maturation factor RimP
VEYQKEGKGRVLRLLIDHPEGVGLEDCMRVNDAVQPMLDEQDPIPEAYRLEVSSPGIFRPLTRREHFERFQGQRIRLRLKGEVAGFRRGSGSLTSCGEDEIGFLPESGEQEINIPFEVISKASLDPKLPF